MNAGRLAKTLVPLGVLAGLAVVGNQPQGRAPAIDAKSIDAPDRFARTSEGAVEAAIVPAVGEEGEAVIQPVEGRFRLFSWGLKRSDDSREQASPPRASQPRPQQSWSGPITPEPDPRFGQRSPRPRGMSAPPVARPPQLRAVPAPRTLELAPELEPAPAFTEGYDEGESVPRRGGRLEPAPRATVRPPLTRGTRGDVRPDTDIGSDVPASDVPAAIRPRSTPRPAALPVIEPAEPATTYPTLAPPRVPTLAPRTAVVPAPSYQGPSLFGPATSDEPVEPQSEAPPALELPPTSPLPPEPPVSLGPALSPDSVTELPPNTVQEPATLEDSETPQQAIPRPLLPEPAVPEPADSDPFDDAAPTAPSTVIDESREIRLPVPRATPRPLTNAPSVPPFAPNFDEPQQTFEGLQPVPESHPSPQPQTRSSPPPRTAQGMPKTSSRDEEKGSRFGGGMRRFFPLMRK